MIDFHSHILPGIDDGSSNMKETIQLLNMEAQQGTDVVIATPHFYATSDSLEHFLHHRDLRHKELLDILERETCYPKIYMGAEVYYFPSIGNTEMISQLCISQTNILLLELPFCQWNEQQYTDVKALIEKKGLTVILAHVERYREYQKNRKIWDAILQLPLYIQLNAGAFLHGKKRRVCIKMLKEGYPIVLGSDCHSIKHRPPNLKMARTVIQKKTEQKILDDIDVLGERILFG